MDVSESSHKISVDKILQIVLLSGEICVCAGTWYFVGGWTPTQYFIVRHVAISEFPVRTEHSWGSESGNQIPHQLFTHTTEWPPDCPSKMPWVAGWSLTRKSQILINQSVAGWVVGAASRPYGFESRWTSLFKSSKTVMCFSDTTVYSIDIKIFSHQYENRSDYLMPLAPFALPIPRPRPRTFSLGWI